MWDSVETYLRERFLTRERLVAESGVPEAILDQLIDGGALPRHTYAVALEASVESYFGARAHRVERRYYHPALAPLAGELAAGLATRSIAELTAERRAAFGAAYRDEVARTGALADGLVDPAELDALIESEWRAWLDGIYGLCTRGNDVAAIVRKEMAIRRIRAITGDAAKATLGAAERAALREAVDALDEAAPPFAPDEREQSSRARWVDRIRARYALPAPPGESG